jgi:hypothetical protein
MGCELGMMTRIQANWSPCWKVLVVTGLITSLNAGCAVNSAVEQDFGKSVTQMQYVQTYDKVAANYPSLKPVKGMDGGLSENVLAEYRKDVSSPKETQKGVIFTINQVGP